MCGLACVLIKHIYHFKCLVGTLSLQNICFKTWLCSYRQVELYWRLPEIRLDSQLSSCKLKNCWFLLQCHVLGISCKLASWDLRPGRLRCIFCPDHVLLILSINSRYSTFLLVWLRGNNRILRGYSQFVKHWKSHIFKVIYQRNFDFCTLYPV